MNELLANAIKAHGGQENWDRVSRLRAHMSLGGPFWKGRGWPDVYSREIVEVETRRERAIFTPFPTPGQRSIFSVGPGSAAGSPGRDQVTVENLDGSLAEERVDPLASFPPFTLSVAWDALQIAYFTSYAVWNYLNTPFLLAYPGVVSTEIEPWDEEGQTWRRLQVQFPQTITTHNADQVFYFDADYMLRRLDYQPTVTGAAIAHYTEEPRSFDGFVFPTRRRVLRRMPDGTANQSVAVITLDIEGVEVEVNGA